MSSEELTKVAARINADVAAKARDAADHFSGPPLRLRLRDVIEEGIKLYLKKLEKKHGAIPPRNTDEPLRGGRRL